MSDFLKACVVGFFGLLIYTLTVKYGIFVYIAVAVGLFVLARILLGVHWGRQDVKVRNNVERYRRGIHGRS